MIEEGRPFIMQLDSQGMVQHIIAGIPGEVINPPVRPPPQPPINI